MRSNLLRTTKYFLYSFYGDFLRFSLSYWTDGAASYSQSSVRLFDELATSQNVKCFCLIVVLIDSIDQTFFLCLVSVVWWISSTVLDHEYVVVLRIFNHSTMGEFVLFYKLFNLSNADQFGCYSFNGDHVVILMNAMLLWCRLTVHSECRLQLYGNWSFYLQVVASAVNYLHVLLFV